MLDILAAHIQWMRRQRTYAERTISARAAVLRQADESLPNGIDDVSTDEIATYLNNQDWSAWTRHTYFGHLTGFYRWAAATDWMTCDPTHGMRPPRCGVCRPKPLSPRDLRAAVDRSTGLWRTAVLLATCAGLRASEIAAIRREDITEETVRIRNGKGGKERYVDTSDILWTHVRDMPLGRLVRSATGRTVTGPWLSARQRKHWVSVGLPHVHLHRLRHTFCTAMAQAGHSLAVIQELMGHASPETTRIYTQVAASQRRQAIATVDAVVRAALEPGHSRLEPAAA